MAIVDEVSSIAKALRCNFTLRDQPISVEQVFSETGLLPAIMRRADQLASFCLGYGLGVSFEESQGAMLGVRVKFDEATPNALRLLCAADVIIELMQNSPSRDITPLDDLMYD
ncbi:MAG TPA: type IV secretion IcmS family protein [Gammaproteobacteria bacterium]|nr:type IV secretion IcmS family protein [Gammaproteobacteria bacterium]